ncbi:MAG TPA: DJ-1/PfpI family protein [Luteitalea sp.]|nr:DJ-1/PfpI family protein [Luteitalea sp.]
MTVDQRKRVALLVEDEFEDADVAGTTDLLRSAGVEVVVVGPIGGRVYRGRKALEVEAQLAAGKARAADFDGILIPGGHAPDRMRMRHAMIDLVRDTIAAGKPVAAIDRGAQLLISVKAVAGRTITCWPSIAIDIKNAGGRYVDRPVVEDGCIITARKADDVPHFAAAILKALGNLQPAS